jgi:hypothetical protein
VLIFHGQDFFGANRVPERDILTLCTKQLLKQPPRLRGFEMSLEAVHDEAFAVECPDVAFSERIALCVPALIGGPDSRYRTVRSVHTLNQVTACRNEPAITDWTEHLSSPLKVRKNVLPNSIIVPASAKSTEFLGSAVNRYSIRRYCYTMKTNRLQTDEDFRPV